MREGSKEKVIVCVTVSAMLLGLVLVPCLRAATFGSYSITGDSYEGTWSGHKVHGVTRTSMGKVIEDGEYSADWSRYDGTIKLSFLKGKVHFDVVGATPDAIYLRGYSTLVMRVTLTEVMTRDSITIRGDQPGSDQDIIITPAISEEDWKEINPAI